MTALHIPVAYGNFPEDGEKVSELVFESEEDAEEHAGEMTEGEYGLNNYSIQTVEVVRE